MNHRSEIHISAKNTTPSFVLGLLLIMAFNKNKENYRI